MNFRIRAFLLLALLLVGATSLMAALPYEVITEYYTDATYTTLCGEYEKLCYNQSSSWGCRTPYYIRYRGENCG